MSHTPGEWCALNPYEIYACTRDKDGNVLTSKIVADVYSSPRTIPEANENTRLIEMAPKLLEHLEAILTGKEKYTGDYASVGISVFVAQEIHNTLDYIKGLKNTFVVDDRGVFHNGIMVKQYAKPYDPEDFNPRDIGEAVINGIAANVMIEDEQPPTQEILDSLWAMRRPAKFPTINFGACSIHGHDWVEKDPGPFCLKCEEEGRN